MKFRVDQIDHAELTVSDRFEAANWYETVLGLEILPEFKFWSDDPNGPLMIGTVNGGTKIALFDQNPVGSESTACFHLIAFRVSGEAFLTFLALVDNLQLRDREGQVLNQNDWKDHTKAFSFYFCDPWSNQLELTTYDYETVRSAISSSKRPNAE